MADDDELIVFRYEGPFDEVNVRHPITGHLYRGTQGSTIRIARFGEPRPNAFSR